MRYKYGLLILILSLFLTGCMAGEGYEDYMEALDRTENIVKGASMVEVSIESILHEELKEISFLESINLTIKDQFDQSLNQSIVDIYYVGNDLGMDLKLYQKRADEIYLKVPFMNGVYAIDSNISDMIQDPKELKSFIKNVSSEWNAMLLSENIFVGEKTIVRNEDGEVKTTKFTVKPTSEQLDAFTESLRKVILSNQSELLDYLSEFVLSDQNVMITERDFEAIVNQIFNSMKIVRYEEVAYMDLDGYIVEEQIEIGIEYVSDDDFVSAFESQTIRIHTVKWDIEKSQNFDFSILDQLEIMPIEKLMEWSVEQ